MALGKVLGIDVGGTKIAVKEFEWNKTSLHPSTDEETRIPSSTKTSFLDSLREFSKYSQTKTYDFVGIGFGGPVDGMLGDQQAHMTNLGWSVTNAEIEEIFPKACVYLANDMKTHGWGALTSSEKSLVALNPLASSRPGNAAFIAAGTGLGESVIAFADRKMHPLAGEGGHASFSPVTGFDAHLHEFLKTKIEGHISWERVLGGRDGFLALTQFLMGPGEKYAQGRATLKLQKQAEMNLDVGRCLIEDLTAGDSFAKSLMKHYARLYGCEAGNLALKCVPYHGVFVGGGIGTRIVDEMKSSFLDGFLDKGRFSSFLAKIPVWLIIDEQNGTRGAAYASIHSHS